MSSFLASVLLAIIALLRGAPDTPFSRTIRALLVERPCRWWLKRTRREAIQMLVLAGLFLFAGEMVMMLGSTDLVLAYALDLSIYIDAILAASILTVSHQVGRVFRGVTSLLPSRTAKPKPRERRLRKADCRKPANDEDGPALKAA